MRQSTFESWPPVGKLFFTALAAFGTFLLVFVAGLLLSFLFYDIDLSTFQQQFTENMSILRYFQFVQSVGLFVVPPFLIAIISGVGIGDYLQINKAPKGKLLFIALAIMPIAMLLISFLGYVNSLVSFPDWIVAMEDAANTMAEKMLRTDNVFTFLANIVVIAVVPAVGEELIFRGLLQKYFIQWTKNIHIGILITAIVFSTIHFQFLGFLPRMAMGLVFGYMLVYSKNIWYPIIAHFVNNALAVTIIYFDPLQSVAPNVSDEPIGQIVGLGLVSLFAVIWLIIVFKRISEKSLSV